jgi:hypothetical protein
MNDLLLKEVGGTAVTVGFHWLDKDVQKRIEQRTHSRAGSIPARILINPPQSIANIIRFRRRWLRDSRN